MPSAPHDAWPWCGVIRRSPRLQPNNPVLDPCVRIRFCHNTNLPAVGYEHTTLGAKSASEQRVSGSRLTLAPCMHSCTPALLGYLCASSWELQHSARAASQPQPTQLTSPGSMHKKDAVFCFN